MNIDDFQYWFRKSVLNINLKKHLLPAYCLLITFFFHYCPEIRLPCIFFLLFLWRLSRVLSKIHKGFALSLVTNLLTLQSQSSYGLVETLTGEFKRKNLCQIQKCICFTFLTFRVHLLPPQNEIQLLPRFVFYSKLVWP